AITAETRAYYLDSDGHASTPFASGTLSAKLPTQGKPDEYVYDPRDTCSAAMESALPPKGFTDQWSVLGGATPQLIYHSAAFERDTPISGFFRLSTWLAIDQPDTDFEVSVYEIGANGESTLLSNDLMRARHREGLRTTRLVQTRQPLHYDFTRFTFVARQVRKGSRLRLTVAAINSMSMQKNYNAGGIVAEESMKDARAVTVRLFHDPDRPSVLYVPIGRGA
ncbi:CocE/NonD family hydrolase, partial [Steroidobacter sp.]|uniref:CocE/NonD family hydrolase n=1 Tax=Steroidobacter sp. TaxID=1978227 RepID=UPI001A40D23A